MVLVVMEKHLERDAVYKTCILHFSGLSAVWVLHLVECV